jgi:Ti-type conjugative transfer relaxase TraA
LAIYHLTVNIISRARGQSAVAAAAYRFGAMLRDERYGVTHNYLGKRGVMHAGILAAEDAPAWVCDRETLWNKVEAAESRRDAQLARLVEVGLPIELTADERVALVRDYTLREFVSKGMVADLCVRGSDHNPHAHIMLTLRGVIPTGFGPKERQWNGKAVLIQWRSAWAERANEHLARAGHSVRIDHRTLEAQQIELLPGRRIGFARARRGPGSLPNHLTDRLIEQQRIAKENGETILADPTVALRVLTQQRATFTLEELAIFLRSRTEDAIQFDLAIRAVTECREWVPLAHAAGERPRFTSRDMIEAERSLVRRSVSMVTRQGHGVTPDKRGRVSSEFSLDAEQCRAFEYLVGEGDAKALVVKDGDKPTLFAALSHAWGQSGLTVTGMAPSRRAADVLEAMAGVKCCTVAEYEGESPAGPELGREAVLLLDGAHMLGLKQLERVLAVADRARAKAVLIADAEQFRAMKVESPFADVLRAITPTS